MADACMLISFIGQADGTGFLLSPPLRLSLVSSSMMFPQRASGKSFHQFWRISSERIGLPSVKLRQFAVIDLCSRGREIKATRDQHAPPAFGWS